MSHETKATAILEREFYKATEQREPVTAQYTDDDRVIITGVLSGNTWIMVIDSDDDKLVFENADTGEIISFDFPNDWPV